MQLSLHPDRARHSAHAALKLTRLFSRLRRAAGCVPCLAALLLLSSPAARAQTADDFFNGGAHFYISNNIPEALVPVEQGLKLYPDDVKLKKLYELLKQQQQQQQQQQSQQNQQNQSQQQKSNNQQNQQSQKQQQSQQNSQQQKQNDQKQSEQQKAERQKQQQQQQAQKSGEQKQNQNESGQPVAAGQMTPEEAKRLLDAQKGDEQFLQLKPQGKPKNPNQAVKDW